MPLYIFFDPQYIDEPWLPCSPRSLMMSRHLLVGRSKSLLSGRVYLYTMRFLGLVLCALACVFFYDGLRLFGLIRA